MRSLVAITLVLSAAVGVSGYTLRFAQPDGQAMTVIREGESFCLVVHDPEKGACGIASFKADLTVFDLKTGAYIDLEGETFREFGIGSGLFFWVDGGDRKRTVQVGGRKSYSDITEMEHNLGSPLWEDGNWEYVDEDVEAFLEGGLMGDLATSADAGHPARKRAARFQYTDYDGNLDGITAEKPIEGRFENMDTLIAIVADQTDRRNIAATQIKILDTISTITATPARFTYGCGASCETIAVTIRDPDENLDCNQVDAVPFFVFVNPGGFSTDDEWEVPPTTDHVTEFCSLMTYGGVLGREQFRGAFGPGDPIFQPIRWYNIYDAPVPYRLKDISTGNVDPSPTWSRYVDYPNKWLDPEVVAANGVGLGRVLFYAVETGVNTGVFEHKFGNLEQLQRALGFRTFPAGTTIAFYYIDPNDFDDLVMTWAEVGNRPRSQTYATDALGTPVSQVSIGDALYVKVFDADANVQGCCPDEVAVHLCNPHGEDDCEWWFGIPEVGNNSGIFFSQSGMRLLPVWDAVGGYQLVWNSGTFEAYNEDTILIRYNSVKVLP
ncbi:MAG: hypothetical protein AB1543_00240 [Candidatus Bipolaricaulota bacterium]